MLNYKRTLTGSSLAIAALFIADLFLPANLLWFMIGIFIAFLVMIILGSIRIQQNFYLISKCEGSRNDKVVSLTFDDGPDGLVTPMILDILKENKVKAAFFVIGSKAEKHPEILDRIDREGHVIGGHSYTHHFFFDFFPARKMLREFGRTADQVYQVTGRKIRLLRPPYGVTNPAIARSIRELNYISIGWSLKSKDTVMKDEMALLKRLKRKLKAGDIILFHDNRTWNVNLLGKFIKYLNEQEYKIERIDDLLNIKAYVN
jgi:peptidoglycan/xylan/chitin deacetylase (PgdA/CDA1 family)